MSSSLSPLLACPSGVGWKADPTEMIGFDALKCSKLALIAACLLVVMWSSSTFGQATKPRQEAAGAPPVGYRVSKETTFLTEPVDENGRLNFLEAVNRALEKEVPLDENAAAQILPLLPAQERDQAAKRAILARLGVTSAEEIKSLQAFCRERSADYGEYEKGLVFGAENGPEDDPLIREWVSGNAAALDEIVAATHKPFFFAPLVEGPFLGGDADWQFRAVWKVSDQIFVRACMAMDDENWPVAISNIRALHRVASLIGRFASPRESGFSAMVKERAVDATFRLILEAETQKSVPLNELMEFLAEVAPTASLSTLFGLNQRMSVLSGIATLAQGAPHNDLGFDENDVRLVERVEVDWDASMKWANTFFNRFDTILQMEDPALRLDAVGELEAKRDELSSRHRRDELLWSLPFCSPRERGRRLGSIVFSQVADTNMEIYYQREMSFQDMDKLAVLAIGAIVYRRSHGDFPSRDQLKQTLPEAVFFEATTGEPIGFQLKDGELRFELSGKNRQSRILGIIVGAGQ